MIPSPLHTIPQFMSATQQAQIQRRYKAVKHRRQKRDEDERKRIENKLKKKSL